MTNEDFPGKEQAARLEIAPDLALEKYDDLEQELRPFLKLAGLFPGVNTIGAGAQVESASRSTPQLAIGNELYLKFMVFRDDSGRYGPQMTAFWSEVSDETPGLRDFKRQGLPYEHVKRGFLDPGSPYFRGGNLDSDAWQKVVRTLTQLEKSMQAYKKLVYQLPIEEAQRAGFQPILLKFLEQSQETS